MSEPWKRIWIYVGLVVLLSMSLEGLVIGLTHKISGGWGYYVQFIMWTPAISALIACRLTGKPLAELGFRWPARKYLLIAWLLPLGYCLLAYLPTWSSPWGGFYDREFVARMANDFGLKSFAPAVQIGVYLLLAGTLGVIRSTNALGEELGWRGYLVPELAKVTSFGGVVGFSALLWTLFHVPALIGADYNAGAPWWYSLLSFSLLIGFGSIAFAWLRLKSDSVWPPVLLHASHNLFVQEVFDRLTVDTGRTRFIITEFGLGLALAMGVFSLWFWRRRALVA